MGCGKRCLIGAPLIEHQKGTAHIEIIKFVSHETGIFLYILSTRCTTSIGTWRQLSQDPRFPRPFSSHRKHLRALRALRWTLAAFRALLKVSSSPSSVLHDAHQSASEPDDGGAIETEEVPWWFCGCVGSGGSAIRKQSVLETPASFLHI